MNELLHQKVNFASGFDKRGLSRLGITLTHKAGEDAPELRVGSLVP